MPGMKSNGMNKKINRLNTFRFPFDIDTRYFLVLAFIFFVLSVKPVNQLLVRRLTIPDLKCKIEKDVDHKLEQFSQLLRDSVLIQKVVSHSLNESQFNLMNQLPFAVNMYDHHELVYWNSDHASYPADTFTLNTPLPYQDQSGFFIAYQTEIASTSGTMNVVALFRIKNENGIENKYFSTNFPVDDQENDFNIKLSVNHLAGSTPLVIRNKTQFFIYKSDDYLRVNDRSGWHLFLSAVPFILFGVSIHTFYKVKIKKKNTQLIFSLLVLTIFIVRGSIYLWGFPMDFNEFGIFSPEYFTTDFLNRSLGDLFINMSLVFWGLLFFIINVQGKVYNLRGYKFRQGIGILVFMISVAAMVYLSNLIHELIWDSVINFDTTQITELDLSSIMGILTLMVIFVNYVCVSVLSRNYLTDCFDNIYVKYGLVLVTALLFRIFLRGLENQGYHLYALVCLVVLFVMQDLNYLKTRFDFSSYKLLLWILIVSIFGAFLITRLIAGKDINQREIFAKRLAGNNVKNKLEWQLSEKLNRMEKDTVLRQIIQKGPHNHKEISDYILLHFFWDHQLDYEACVNVKVDSTSSDSKQVKLLYRTESDAYVLFPFISQIQHDQWRVEIDLTKRRPKGLSEYTDLLTSQTSDDLQRNQQYSSAVYRNDTLIQRTGTHLFSYRLPASFNIFNSAGKAFIRRGDFTEVWSKGAKNDIIVVIIKQNNGLFLFTTLFAYIFLLYFVTISLYILGNIIARSNLNYKRFINLMSINLRLRIHFSILLIELISFIVIGCFTSYFLYGNANEEMRDNVSKYNISIQEEVKKVPVEIEARKTAHTIQDSSCQGYFTIMKQIAERFAININLYSIGNGRLLFSSLPPYYRQKIISDRLEPEVYHKLKSGIFNNLILEEKLGLLHYMSSYFLIRNAAGEEIGIVQIPFFQSSTNIRLETTRIIIILINIYVFVFLFSAIIAFFLTKSVTRPFTYIVKQFTKINLSKTNEPLKWFDSDEIGLLIKEYNRMLRKLENTTVLLAKNERELAWREMAKQVAHEIKNPLTPMKLSLQMLERAIKNNATNVNEMTIMMTKTLVEQIDNLSLIATNFSNFAKLPVSTNEIFALNELLYSVTGMYHDDNSNEFLFMIPDYEINLYADKSQVMRVLTNIIQNAIQSIPEERKGNIALTVSKVKDNFVRISISDNGEGISAEKAQNLFQPYFTTKTSGTGLGLAMCKDILEKSGGKINFKSVVGEGTIFHIDLPMYLPE